MKLGSIKNILILNGKIELDMRKNCGSFVTFELRDKKMIALNKKSSPSVQNLISLVQALIDKHEAKI